MHNSIFIDIIIVPLICMAAIVMLSWWSKLKVDEHQRHLSPFTCSYSVMLNCWDTDPAQRPTFSELVATLSALLEASAGYLTLEMTGETGIDVSS